MKEHIVSATYFSPTGTTRKVVTAIAETIAERFGVGMGERDFTLPWQRAEPLCFEAHEVVVFGTPVYAGRVPNVLLKFLATIEGNGAIAVPVVLFGNRNFDDALIELRDILAHSGMHPIAAGAFVGEHSFSTTLAAGRPDEQDMESISCFAHAVADKILSLKVGVESPVPVIDVEGVPSPYRGYYQPRDRAGNPVDIRKVKPLTMNKCNLCMVCAKVCPMGSISADNPFEYTGICIKCGACIKRCPLHAKYYEDAGYLYHKRELEEDLTRRAKASLFL